MKSYKELSIAELKELQGELNKEYEEAKAKGLKLNMARGLPSAEQLDMEADFFNTFPRNLISSQKQGLIAETMENWLVSMKPEG